MKLVYANGVQRDREVDVAGPGVSFGREEDNDIVVNDEAVSPANSLAADTLVRYQAYSNGPTSPPLGVAVIEPSGLLKSHEFWAPTTKVASG